MRGVTNLIAENSANLSGMEPAQDMGENWRLNRRSGKTICGPLVMVALVGSPEAGGAICGALGGVTGFAVGNHTEAQAAQTQTQLQRQQRQIEQQRQEIQQLKQLTETE